MSSLWRRSSKKMKRKKEEKNIIISCAHLSRGKHNNDVSVHFSHKNTKYIVLCNHPRASFLFNCLSGRSGGNFTNPFVQYANAPSHSICHNRYHSVWQTKQHSTLYLLVCSTRIYISTQKSSVKPTGTKLECRENWPWSQSYQTFFLRKRRIFPFFADKLDHFS